MTHSLSHYISGSPDVDTLGQKYGDKLQKMSMAEKLLLIKSISGALMETLLCPDFNPSIDGEIGSNIREGYDVSNDLRESLKTLDACDETQFFALLTALVAYVSEDFLRFGSMEDVVEHAGGSEIRWLH